MREIKFRAWSKEKKAFIAGFNMVNFHSYFNQGLEPSIYRYNTKWMLSEIELMQYTGLKDKNGKDIYEGDLIQFKSYFVSRRFWSKLSDIPIIDEECRKQREDVHIEHREVKWDRGVFSLGYKFPLMHLWNGERLELGEGTHSHTESKYWDFEVIGNIYENPELLKQ